MALTTFNLKQNDTNHVYKNMIGEHVTDAFIDAWFSAEVPSTGLGSNLKAVC